MCVCTRTHARACRLRQFALVSERACLRASERPPARPYAPDLPSIFVQHPAKHASSADARALSPMCDSNFFFCCNTGSYAHVAPAKRKSGRAEKSAIIHIGTRRAHACDASEGFRMACPHRDLVRLKLALFGLKRLSTVGTATIYPAERMETPLAVRVGQN